MNKILCACIICFLIVTKSSAQYTGDSLRYLLPHDSLFIVLDEFPEKIITHTIAKKQTIFGLARQYGLEIEELAYFNPGMNLQDIKIGDKIKIPLPNAAIKRFNHKKFVRWKYAPIYYRVKPGDSMFKIAKTYFKMPIDTLKKRNKYWKDDISEGKVLQVAWLSTNGVPDSLQHFARHPLWMQSDTLEERFLQASNGKKILHQRGVTVWSKNNESNNTDSYILHRYAKIGSIIVVKNPMNNRKVYVKCIGRLPARTYTNEVLAVVSNSVAKLLGVRDERFYSNLDYTK